MFPKREKKKPKSAAPKGKRYKCYKCGKRSPKKIVLESGRPYSCNSINCSIDDSDFYMLDNFYHWYGYNNYLSGKKIHNRTSSWEENRNGEQQVVHKNELRKNG